ncbi:Ul36-like domain-containing protein [Pandoravirus kuranda]|uniref:Ul36-like domain-containing protein n=1 Tax=Pandoravirus kuranda TaxID=3019033 RepID=A0AA95J6A7_9VIRU|nr:Ul36-like domain-containing protein [Pandoravirus kuranda]
MSQQSLQGPAQTRQQQQQPTQRQHTLPQQPARATIVPTSAPRSVIRPTPARPPTSKPSIVPTSAVAVPPRPLVAPLPASRATTNTVAPPGNRVASIAPRSAPQVPVPQQQQQQLKRPAHVVAPPPIIRPLVTAAAPGRSVDAHARQNHDAALPVGSANVSVAPAVPAHPTRPTVTGTADSVQRSAMQSADVQPVTSTSPPAPLMPLDRTVTSAMAITAHGTHGAAPPLGQTVAPTALVSPSPDATPAEKGKARAGHGMARHEQEPPHSTTAPLGHADTSAMSAPGAADTGDLGDARRSLSCSPRIDAPPRTTQSPSCIDMPDVDADRREGLIPKTAAADEGVGVYAVQPAPVKREIDAGDEAGSSVHFGADAEPHMLAGANGGLTSVAPEPDAQVHRRDVDGDHDGAGDHTEENDADSDKQRCEREHVNIAADGARRIKRQRVAAPVSAGEDNDRSCAPIEKEVDVWQRDGGATAATHLHPSACEADPAPEPAETRDTHHLDRHHKDRTGAAHKETATTQKGSKRRPDEANNDIDGNDDDAPHAVSTQKPDVRMAPTVCIVYSAPPADERRAEHRRHAAGPSVQVSPCGRVIDRPVPRETVLTGPWSLPPQAEVDWTGAGTGGSVGDTNPTRTAVRFWLTRPVESVRVIGAPCEFCLAIGGALIEPHSQGGVLEMGDVCDTECRPSRMPPGVAGARLDRALRAVRRARVDGQAIAPGILDLGGIETALVFRGPLDRDTLDRMVVRFAAYNVWRECRSADGKTITDGRWLYGS